MSEKRMFEFVEGSSSKFWEIWRSGTEVRTRYGRIGSDGQTTVKDEGSDDKAEKLYAKLVKEKTGKGYVEKNGAASPAPAPAPAPAPKAAAKKAAKAEEEEDEEEDDGGAEEGGGGSGDFARYEVDEKFWAIKLDGSSHTVRFGKIGTNGSEKTKEFDSPAAAKKDHDKLVKEKTGKGYTLVSSSSSSASSASSASSSSAPSSSSASTASSAAPATKKKAATPKLHPLLRSFGCRVADFDADDVYVFTCSVDGNGDLKVHYESTANPGDFICTAAALESGADKIHLAQGAATLGGGSISVSETEPTEAFAPFLLSRALFAALKAGKPVAWPTVLTGDGKFVEVKKTGTGERAVKVDGKKQKLKVILAEGDDVRLQILDDASWPVVLVDDEADECGIWVLASKEGLAVDDLDADDTGDEDEDEDEEGGDGEDGEGGWRRFEMEEKFWAIRLDGASHTVKYGKIGTDGQEKTKTFDDEDDAQKDYDKLVKEKTGKGYEEVSADD